VLVIEEAGLAAINRDRSVGAEAEFRFFREAFVRFAE